MYIDVLLFKDRRKLKGKAPLPPIGAPDVEVAPQNLATPYEGFRRRAIKGIDKSEFITKEQCGNCKNLLAQVFSKNLVCQSSILPKH